MLWGLLGGDAVRHGPGTTKGVVIHKPHIPRTESSSSIAVLQPKVRVLSS